MAGFATFCAVMWFVLLGFVIAAIAALIAENQSKDQRIETQSEIIKRQAVSNVNICQQRDEAVALLRANMMYPDDGRTARETHAFLARIDGNHQPASDANPSQSRL